MKTNMTTKEIKELALQILNRNGESGIKKSDFCNGICDDCVLNALGECDDCEDIITSEDYKEFITNGLW